jgi:hypothetical protein
MRALMLARTLEIFSGDGEYHVTEGDGAEAKTGRHRPTGVERVSVGEFERSGYASHFSAGDQDEAAQQNSDRAAGRRPEDLRDPRNCRFDVYGPQAIYEMSSRIAQYTAMPTCTTNAVNRNVTASSDSDAR